VLKPIFPNNVGLFVHEGFSLGVEFGVPPGVTPLGGYWIIPICLALGVGVLVLTQKLARRWVNGLRQGMKDDRLASPDSA
jgi:hypothetical protein